MRNLVLFCLSALIFFGSCRKKEDPAVVNPPGSNTLGKLDFTFQNMAGADALQLDGPWYRTEAGDSLQVYQFKYYATNFVLHSDSGDFTEWESYYLIDQSIPSSRSFTIDSIPPGRYNKLTFLIGVDEKRNTSGAQTGVLDPGYNMFWDWKSGYIMAKLEGTSPQGPFGNTISFHIAGFKAGESVVRKVTLDFPTPIDINQNSTKNLHIKADMLEWFKNPRLIKFSETSVIGVEGADAVRMADNYADMFKIDHID